jgi:anti-sigma regulatory factor (Ser/Thr protein kinase)
MVSAFTSFYIADRSFVAYAKREIHNAVSGAAFSELRIGEIDIVVSEICSNLIKHGKGGELLFRVDTTDAESPFVDILCIDSGAGIADVGRVMKDGFSTSSTLGHGLGAIQRLSTVFEVFSIPGWGTVLYSCIHAARQTIYKKPDKLTIKGLCIPKSSETFCGDGYAVKKNEDFVQYFFGDGLGHGEAAHQAVKYAADSFLNTNETEPVDILRRMHQEVRKTRGLVGTIASLDVKADTWRICGIGNIMTRIYKGIEYKNYMSYNGTIGLNIPTTMNSTAIPCEKNQRLIFCSDGIRSGWDIAKFPSILRYSHAVLAAVIYKDFNRKTDDASVLIVGVN